MWTVEPFSERWYVLSACVLIVSVITIYTDWRYHKIYNAMTFPAMLAGLAANGLFARVEGLELSLAGMGVGLGLQFIPFALKLIKAGDVKLLMCVGALMGPVFVFWGFLYGAVLYALYAVPILAFGGKLRKSLNNIRHFFLTFLLGAKTDPGPPASQQMMPWGIGLALGFAAALVLTLRLGQPYFLLSW